MGLVIDPIYKQLANQRLTIQYLLAKWYRGCWPEAEPPDPNLPGFCWNCRTRYAKEHVCSVKLEPPSSMLHAQFENLRETIEYLHARWHRENDPKVRS